MPVNYLEIKKQLPAFCQRAQIRQQELGTLKQVAMERLTSAAGDPSSAVDKIHTEAARNPMLRCAIPAVDAINSKFGSENTDFIGTILAADGSQVIPSRHNRVQFGALNIAAVILQAGSGAAPKIHTTSTLLAPEDLSEGDGTASEAYIALLRDLKERELSAELAQKYSKPVVSLSDGGLELFREPRTSKQYDQVLGQYIEVLKDLSTSGVIYAGYVDKPGSNLVVNMLDVLAQGGEGKTSAGLIDRMLFTDILTQPGDRSAIFGIQSQQAARFSGSQAIHFFYLNVGSLQQQKIARVEIPGWVAGQPELVDLLQSAILQQCRVSGRDYPYLLHRAHEEAVIRYDDAARLEEMILASMLDQHIPAGDKSGKQYMKDLPGKKRMGK